MTKSPTRGDGASARRGPRVLYLVYWGAAEPLGQSLVLPAVKRLARLGANLTLVTFEKQADLGRGEEMQRIRTGLDQEGVQWMPLRYHKRPKIPATSYDIVQGIARSIVARLRTRPDIIHARTFIGGLMGLALAPLLGARLIYHNEGFYPDEQVDAGVWALDSSTHRIAKRLERRMYARADAIIALSRRAKAVIENLADVQRNRSPVIVVPSCVDLSHFKALCSKTWIDESRVRLVYSGSVGGRYMLDAIGRFVTAASREMTDVRLRVLTRSDHGLVRAMLERGGLSGDSWSVESVPYSAMPGELADHDAAMHFLPNGISEHGGSPTKIGEYWAVGLPVVVTPNVSDIHEIIRRERVGVVVSEHSDDSYRSAARELRTLLEDPELHSRCRQAAETHYALEPACERQMALYDSLISHSARETARINPSELSSL